MVKEKKTKTSVRSIAITAMLLAVLVAQEYLLIGIPNVQLTAFLILLYAQYLRSEELFPLVIAYVFIDNLIGGSFSWMYTPAMFIAWMLLAIVARPLRKRPTYVKFIWVTLFGFIYGWIFLPFSAIVMHFNFQQMVMYLYYDIPFEVIMAASNAVAFLVLYEPLTRVFDIFFPDRALNIIKLT